MGVKRVVAPGKLSLDLVDEFWYFAVVALFKEPFEGEEDLSFRVVGSDSRVLEHQFSWYVLVGVRNGLITWQRVIRHDVVCC